LLLALRDSVLDIGGIDGEDRTAQLTRLAAVSNGLEGELLNHLEAGGYRLPDHAQQLVEGLYVRPDFAYHRPDGDTAVFVDGPVHDHDHVAEKDQDAGRKLENLGWLVLRFKHDERDTWDQLIYAYPGVFGPGRTGTQS
jgi:very-short-patch-repair endonuclease